MDKKEETLDPSDWEAFRATSHRVVDEAIDYLRDVRERPIWQNTPQQVSERLSEPLPTSPMPIGQVCDQVFSDIMAFPMGNIHPRFWMWYMGASNATGALGDFLAAINGSNLGGGNHAPALVDAQVVDWMKQMVGFPAEASGTLVSGGSMANIIALTVARNAKAGIDLREHGVAAVEKPLVFYGSDQLHGCHQTAVELLGLGNRALRRIPTTDGFAMDIRALEAAIAEDEAAGRKPACVIATAGTVNSGAIDNVEEIGQLCRERGLWFHVDGCIGALLAIAPQNRSLVAGIEKADSIALDPHKLLHAPFEVGCVLVRAAGVHRQTFTLSSEYLQGMERGIAAAEWLHDYGVQTSRGFRALKVWMALKEHGVEKFGRLIDQNIDQARYLGECAAEHERLELMAPVTVDIACFRYNDGERSEEDVKAINMEIMLRLQEEGTAALSDTMIGGRHCLRAAIANHRTRREDIDLLVAEVLRLGDLLAAERRA